MSVIENSYRVTTYIEPFKHRADWLIWSIKSFHLFNVD